MQLSNLILVWMGKKMRKSYTELMTFQTFEDRFLYLQIQGFVGDPTFGNHRYLNQMLYQMNFWKKVRREVILRDNGFDLAHEDYPILHHIYIHHINPITIDDILERRYSVFDLENLISTSFDTHNAIHYGNLETLANRKLVIREPNDTCPWR